MAQDPFEDVLNLEERFYAEGYRQGSEDGAQAGKVEGRSFGLQKGFEKFVESGRLHGRAVVWASRIKAAAAAAAASVPAASSLPPLRGRGGARLEKNIALLYALTEPESQSTENTDEAVNHFDNRLRQAQGRARVIERMVGEEDGGVAGREQQQKRGGKTTQPGSTAVVPPGGEAF